MVLITAMLVIGVACAIAAWFVIREAGRMAQEPPPPVFDMEEAYEWVVENVPDLVAATLTPADVRRILDFQLEFFQRKGVAGNGSSSHPPGDVIVGGAETVEYILDRAAATKQLEEERQQIDQTQITAVEQEIDKTQADLDTRKDEIEGIEDEIEAIGRRRFAADARMRASKSSLDALKYRYDRALASGDEKEIAERTKEVDELTARWVEQQREVQELDSERDAKRAALLERQSAHNEAEKKLAELNAALTQAGVAPPVHNDRGELAFYDLTEQAESIGQRLSSSEQQRRRAELLGTSGDEVAVN